MAIGACWPLARACDLEPRVQYLNPKRRTGTEKSISGPPPLTVAAGRTGAPCVARLLASSARAPRGALGVFVTTNRATHTHEAVLIRKT